MAYVAEKFNQVQTQGPTAVIWQQVELAVYLTYIYGELQKNCTYHVEQLSSEPIDADMLLVNSYTRERDFLRHAARAYECTEGESEGKNRKV